MSYPDKTKAHVTHCFCSSSTTTTTIYNNNNTLHTHNMENHLYLVVMVAGLVATVNGDTHNAYNNNNPPFSHSTYEKQSSYSSNSNNNNFEPLSYPAQTNAESYVDEGQNDAFDFSLIVIPLLIIAGISLLFPTITNVETRKRRHTFGKHTHRYTCIHTYTLVTLTYSLSVQSS